MTKAHVVWGLRTQSSCNTGTSPYFMVYGAEAVLPTDIAFRSPRVERTLKKIGLMKHVNSRSTALKSDGLTPAYV
jgi:hypothetical protein